MKKGFTLTEVLVAVAILILLTAIILPNFSQMRQRGRDVRRVTDLKGMQVALERYFTKYGQYPDIGGKEVAISGDVSCYTEPYNAIAFNDPGFNLNKLVTEGFMSSFPKDPRNRNNFCYLYRVNTICSDGLGLEINDNKKYTLVFKPERFDTFGGREGGEHSVKDWSLNEFWLCLDSE